jgi:hypothetical protein
MNHILKYGSIHLFLGPQLFVDGNDAILSNTKPCLSRFFSLAWVACLLCLTENKWKRGGWIVLFCKGRYVSMLNLSHLTYTCKMNTPRFISYSNSWSPPSSYAILLLVENKWVKYVILFLMFTVSSVRREGKSFSGGDVPQVVDPGWNIPCFLLTETYVITDNKLG